MPDNVSSAVSHTLRFGSYEADLAAGQLRKHGIRIPIREQSFRVLAALLERPGQVITREELRQRLWHSEVFVDFENNLNAIVARLRQALCDVADQPRYIETLPKRGYRFLAEVNAPSAVPEPAKGRRARLLVLPFLNLSGDPAQEYFSDAMTDAVITALARLAPEHLAVIARTTAMHYKDSHKDVALIGRELDLDYVVEGGVRRNGEQVELNVQLVEAGGQTHLFAQRYDVPMRDIFGLHGSVAQAIARHIPATADALHSGAIWYEDEQRKPTEDLAAYNEYIKGRFEMWKLIPHAMAQARRHFEAALACDPGFALACNALAEFYWYTGIFGHAPSRETDRVGRSFALRALKIDGRSAETHALLSFFPGRHDSPGEIDYYNWEEIENELAYARALDPSSRLVRIRYAMVHAELGHPEESAAELERALESDPLSLDVRSWLAVMLYLSRDYERALEQAQRNLELQPEHFVALDVLGQVYLAMQRFGESAAAFRKAVRLSGELPMMLGWLGLSSGLGGDGAGARSALNRLRELASRRYVAPTCFAWNYIGLGEIDEAFSWLERAVEAPDRMMEPIKTYPFLDPLRADARFHTLLRKMNLKP